MYKHEFIRLYTSILSPKGDAFTGGRAKAWCLLMHTQDEGLRFRV